MRRLPPTLLLLVSIAGVGLVVDAVLRGAATFALVVIVPVVVGSSPELLAGVGLIFAGLLGWALLASESDGGPFEEPASARTDGRPASFGSAGGGVVLLGPFPIFLGGYRPASARVRWAWVAAGVAVTAAAWLMIAAAVYFR